jgi:hypothetical protein
VTTPPPDFDPDETPRRDPIKGTNVPIPGTMGGPIEATKRAIMVACRDAITGSALSQGVSGSKISVDMEYPMKQTSYPGVWVQFSFTRFIQAGLGHQPFLKTIENAGTPTERVNWEPIREFIFEGRITLSIVALTSLERDRIADALTVMLMFSRPPELAITDSSRDTKQFRQLIDALVTNPYVSITANTDIVVPGGQSMTTGVPWDEELPGYEDSYSFDIQGQTNIVFKNDGTYDLRRIDPDPEIAQRPPLITEWQ